MLQKGQQRDREFKFMSMISVFLAVSIGSPVTTRIFASTEIFVVGKISSKSMKSSLKLESGYNIYKIKNDIKNIRNTNIKYTS